MSRHLTDLPGARLYELEARDLRRGPSPRLEKVRVRADTRAGAFARLAANDFEPLLDCEDLGLSYEQSPQPPVDMRAAIAREIPAP